MKPDSRHERDSPRRFRAAPGRLRDYRATVVGLNAIGRQVAMLLAARGIGHLRLCDAGLVPTKRYADQGYFAEDAAQAKMHATAELCHRLNPMLDVEAVARLTPRELGVGDAVFCCLDSPTAQQFYLHHDIGSALFRAEARFTGNVVCILVVCDGQKTAENRRLGRKALRCLDRQNRRIPLHIAAIAAAVMVGEFLRFVSGHQSDRMIRLNIHTLQSACAACLDPSSSSRSPLSRT